MKQFDGFPDRTEFTPLPNIFFSALLPEISNMAELKVTLYILPLLYRKRGYPRFVTCGELLASASLVASLKELGKPEAVLLNALSMAAERGTIIHIALDKDSAPEDIYLLNTVSNKQVAVKIQSGEIKLDGLKAAPSYVAVEPPPDIFSLYEQNIGMLTPMIAEELREAERLYPANWIRDAIKEAVSHGTRKWSYISAILERWSAEGKSDGTHQRDFKEDPNKYIKGKYGHMVQR